jgi:alpha-D-ribose 1-methylphosphonate 5-phosphate C-P lyase
LTRQPQTLIAAKEKRLIAAVVEVRDSHRTTHKTAKVIHVQRRLAGERIAGGQGGVFQVFKPSPVKVVGPCF